MAVAIMNPTKFLDWNPRQTLNQWLCIVFLITMCVWFIYFFVNRSITALNNYYDALGNSLGNVPEFPLKKSS